MISELMARVFFTRNVAHYAHFTTKSYSQHMALGSFYGDIIEALDSIIEAYIGQFDECPKFQQGKENMPKDLCKYLRAEADWIEEHRSEIADSSPTIENMVDGLTALFLQVVYKLENLK